MIKKLIFFYFILFSRSALLAKSDGIKTGIILFNDNKLEQAKFKFEQEIVYNPKSELSYLYLSKIFNKQNKKNLEEQNLNTVMLLNPKNEEAIYNLAKLKLEDSNYSESKKLINQLLVFCKNYCTNSVNIICTSNYVYASSCFGEADVLLCEKMN